MACKIEQTADYLGNGKWNWHAWIEAPSPELKNVESVVWYLHPTYAHAVVETQDRDCKFEIKRSAWGRFLLRAEIKHRDGGITRLRRQLQLWYPDEEAAPLKDDMATLGQTFKKNVTRPGAPKVFLSYGTEDRIIANAVAEALRKNGFAVSSPDQVQPGMPWQPALQKLSRESDLVLGIVSSEFASPNVVTELNNAHRAEKPNLTLVGPDVSSVFGLDPGLVRNVADASTPDFEDQVVDLVRQRFNAYNTESLTATSAARPTLRFR